MQQEKTYKNFNIKVTLRQSENGTYSYSFSYDEIGGIHKFRSVNRNLHNIKDPAEAFNAGFLEAQRNVDVYLSNNA